MQDEMLHGRTQQRRGVLTEVLGVSKEHDTCDLLSNGVVDISGGGGSEGGSLTVSSSNDDGLRALRVRLLEMTNHLADSGGSSSTGKGILANTGSVCASDTLNPDIALAVLGLELGSNHGSQSSLNLRLDLICHILWFLNATYQVTGLSGAASVDEDDTGASAGAALGEIVAGDATTEKLASLESGLLRSRESRGCGGHESSGDGELHFDGVVGKILLWLRKRREMK